MLISLTSADSGRTVTLRVGDSVKLLLDDTGMQWSSVTESQPGVLAPAPSPAPPPHGQLAIWTAVARGTDSLKSVGTAWCAAGVACPMFARLFDVTLVVS